MLPHWIELNPEDLVQGLAVLALAVTFFVINLFSSAGRA